MTPEQVRERDRGYQQKRRERSNNGYARAYRRATQRLVKWAQQEKPDLWQSFLDQEIAVGEAVPGAPYKPAKCTHMLNVVGGAVYVCDTCGAQTDIKELSDPGVADEVADAIEAFL